MNKHTHLSDKTLKASKRLDHIAATPDFRLRPTVAALAFIAMASTVPVVLAQTTSSGDVTGSSGGGAALTIGDASGSTGELSVGGSSTQFSSDQLQIGVSGTGRLNVINGASFITNVVEHYIGVRPSGVGLVTVDGQGSTLEPGWTMNVGNAGRGSVVVSNGGRLSLSGSPSGDPDLNIGVLSGTPGGSGSVTVTGKDATGGASTLSVANNIQVGMAGTGRLEVSDGAQASAVHAVMLGVDAGSDGSVTVKGADSKLTGRGLTVGVLGKGALSVLDGASVATDVSIDVAEGVGSIGTVSVDGGGSKLTSSGNIQVGSNGNGSLTVSNGGAVSTTGGSVFVGVYGDSQGQATVTGAGSTLTTSDELAVGFQAKGSMTVAAGAQVSVGTTAYVGNGGRAVTGSGALTVTGTGSQLTVGEALIVGQGVSGSLSVLDGATVKAASAAVGTNVAGVGTVLVDGEGSKLDITDNTTVGDSGSGAITVSNGGALQTGRRLLIADETGSVGSVTVTGAKSTLGIASSLTVGEEGTGRFELSGGAQAVVGNGVYVANEEGSTGTLTVTGSSSKLYVTEPTTVAREGAGDLHVTDGGTLSTGDMRIANRRTASGTVTVDGKNSLLEVRGELEVGQDGKASLTVSNGAQATVARQATIGINTGSGSVTVTGTGSQLTVGERLSVGEETSGTLSVLQGGTVQAASMSLGIAATGNGSVMVDGKDSRLAVGGTVVVGDAGGGSVVVSNGGALTTTMRGNLSIGTQAGAPGGVTVIGKDDNGKASMLDVDRTLQVGGAGTGRLQVLGGAQASVKGELAVGAKASGDGTVIVSGAGSRLTTGDGISVGDSGTGTLSVLDGASVETTNWTYLGYEGSGTARVDGKGSRLASEGIEVGGDGTGSLVVSNGGAVSTTDTVQVGIFGGAQGQVTVTGAGSTLTIGNELIVGYGSKGSMMVADGARVSVGSNVSVGMDGADSAGALAVTGASSIDVAGTTTIGGAGTGTAAVQAGGTLATGDLVVGKLASGAGAVTVEGAGSTLQARGTLRIGGSGHGVLSVSDGGALTAQQDLVVADAAGSQGRLSVTGAGAKAVVAGALQVGRSGSGALTLSNGAQATSATTSVGSNAGATGTVGLAGAGSSLTTGDVFLGRADPSDPANTTGGTASLSVADAAVLHAGTVSVATSAGSVGTLNIGADAASAAAAPGTIDAKNIVFGKGNGSIVLNHTAQDLTLAPTIDGTGRVRALSGTTTLASGSTYSGGTSITGATTTLKGSATSFGSGAIQNDGALVIDQPADAAFANAMAGTGALTKTGAGILNLTGDASGFTGATTVAAGRLAVNGSLSGSAVTVQSGATLSGAGTVGGVRAQSGATVAPGNSPGTLTVTGDYRQASGATYAVEVVPGSTVSDQIAVGGTATLDSGAILNVSKYGAGNYRPGARYTVLTSLGGVKGTYTLIGDTAASAFFSLGATYDANHVYLDYTQSHTFADFAKTPNETAAASGLQKLADSDTLRTKVLALRTGTEAQHAYDQLSGELHASVKTVALEDSRFVREATRRQMHASGEDRKGSGESVWAHAYGSSGRYDGDGNAAGLKRDIGGLFAGTDAAVSADTRLGIVGGYGRSRITLQEGRGSATVDTYSLGLYGATQWDRTRLSYGANEAWHKLATSRSVGLEGFADQLSADYRARTTQLYGDIGYRMGAELALAPAALEPFASLAWVDLRTPGVQERGGAAALGMAKGSTQVGFATLGVRSAATLDLGGVPVVASGLLGWRGVLGGTTLSSANGFAGAGGAAGFVVQGVPLARNVAALEANVSAALTPTLTLGLAYAGQIGSGFSDHGIRASLALKF